MTLTFWVISFTNLIFLGLCNFFNITLLSEHNINDYFSISQEPTFLVAVIGVSAFGSGLLSDKFGRKPIISGKLMQRHIIPTLLVYWTLFKRTFRERINFCTYRTLF